MALRIGRPKLTKHTPHCLNEPCCDKGWKAPRKRVKPRPAKPKVILSPKAAI